MEKDLTKWKITKTLVLFALPMILGNLVQQIYNIADTIIVWKYVWDAALASVWAAFPVFFLLVSILIGLFILYSGIKLVGETVSPLIGLTPENEFVQNIINDVVAYDGVLGVHDVVCHSYGPSKVFITLHAEVDGYQNVMELHDLIDIIEVQVGHKYGIELTIHMDPLDTKNPEIPVLKEVIEKTIGEINERITFHDLRLVAGPTHTNVLFDVVIPNSLKDKREEVIQSLRKAIKELNEKYFLVITIDSAYIHF